MFKIYKKVRQVPDFGLWGSERNTRKVNIYYRFIHYLCINVCRLFDRRLPIYNLRLTVYGFRLTAPRDLPLPTCNFGSAAPRFCPLSSFKRKRSGNRASGLLFFVLYNGGKDLSAEPLRRLPTEGDFIRLRYLLIFIRNGL